MEPKFATEDDCDSLWAISKEGTLWQINPTNLKAEPVMHLLDLSPVARVRLQAYMVQRWTQSPPPPVMSPEVGLTVCEE